MMMEKQKLITENSMKKLFANFTAQLKEEMIFFFFFIYFIFTHNQLEINHSSCRNKDCE